LDNIGIVYTTRQYPNTCEGLEQRLYRNPYDFDRASVLEQTRDEKFCQTPKDSGRAFTLGLQGGLPTGREALRPSEPQHSPDKVTPSYYTKNGSVATGISKMWCVCVNFHR
jgi:hypothetical protein